MADLIIPSRIADRLARARQRGYLVTCGSHRGIYVWQKECCEHNWPSIIVLRERRTWHLRCELERWRFTDLGERIVSGLLHEFGGSQVYVCADVALAWKLPIDAAELIAGRLVAWVRKAEARRSEVQR